MPSKCEQALSALFGRLRAIALAAVERNEALPRRGKVLADSDAQAGGLDGESQPFDTIAGERLPQAA